MKKKGCAHNPQCQHVGGYVGCSSDVKGGACNPPTWVRVELGITLENVDSRDFARFLKKNKGRMPVQGFASR